MTRCVSPPNQKGSESWCLFSKVCAGACFPRSAQNSKVSSRGRRTKNDSATSSAASQEMRCSVRSERQVVILATGLWCYWWKFPSSRGLKGVSILRVVCLFLGFQRLTRSFCWYLYEDHECASAVPSGFCGSSTHIGDPAAFLFSRCPFSILRFFEDREFEYPHFKKKKKSQVEVGEGARARCVQRTSGTLAVEQHRRLFILLMETTQFRSNSVLQD